MDMRNFISLVEAAETPQNLLVIVHPGSACGSADFNIGRYDAQAQRDGLTHSIASWAGNVIVLSGDFDGELRQPRYVALGTAIKGALARAKANKQIAIMKRAPDPEQVEVIAQIMAKLQLPPETRIEVTGAWTGHQEEGCVDSVMHALHKMGYAKAFISDNAIFIDNDHDEDDDDDLEECARLLEMPQLGADEDFDLSNPEINRLEYERLLHSHYEEVQQNGQFLFGSIEQGQEGELFYADVKAKQLLYSVQYDIEQTKAFGTVVIQRVLWKKQGAANGIPLQGFYILLDKYGSIMTDHSQTDAGRAFWMKRMAEAASKGLTIAAIDDGGIRTYDRSQSLDAWIEEQDAWGEHHSYKAVAFVISKKRI